MKHILSAALVAGLALSTVAPAFAEDEAGAAEGCKTVAADQWISEAKVQEIAAQKGWTVAGIKKEDGCWEVKGKDGTGQRIEAYLDPATGDVVKTKD